MASIFCAAGTASAGSPRVSTVMHAVWWPRTPPAWLISAEAVMQPAAISGPKLASGPVNGLKLAKVRVPEYVFGVALGVVVPHAAATTAASTTRDAHSLIGAGLSTILIPHRDGNLSDN